MLGKRKTRLSAAGLCFRRFSSGYIDWSERIGRVVPRHSDKICAQVLREGNKQRPIHCRSHFGITRMVPLFGGAEWGGLQNPKPATAEPKSMLGLESSRVIALRCMN
jgi:hypothetical protein